MFGVWIAGYLLTYWRAIASPGRMMNWLLWLNILVSILGANLCNWYWTFPHLVPVAGMIIGAYDVCLCCFVNERFNTDKFAFIFGCILSFSAAGTLLSDYLLYKVIYH